MSRTVLCVSLVVAALGCRPVSAQPLGETAKPNGGASLTLPGISSKTVNAAPAALAAAEAVIKANDKNGDRKLNADECPFKLRPSFGALDLNHDGYLDANELGVSLGMVGEKSPIQRGKVTADFVYTVADDFVVEVYLNGEKLGDDRREMTGETFGAADEKINIEVREGDWLVFNVVNNRFRWGGVSYFAVAGMKSGSGVGFVSELDGSRWSYCDDPGQVKAFIADPAHLADQRVRRSEGKWDRGDARMNELTDGWKGSSVWGGGRNTWIKYVAPSPGSRIGVTR